MANNKYLTPFECRKWPERILTVSGLWEHEDIDKKKQLLLKVYINVVGIYLNVGMLLEVLAIFLIGGGYKELADNSASLVSIINFHVKAFIIRGRQKRIKELLDQMDLETFKPQNKEEEKLLKDASKRANFWGGTFTISCIITDISILLGLVFLKLNVFNFWYPFDSSKAPGVYYANTYQVLFLLYGMLYSAATDWILFWFFCYMNYQYKLVGLRIALIGFDNGIDRLRLTDKNYNDIMENIKLHIKTREFVADFNETFNQLLFVQAAQCIIVLSMKILLIFLANNSPIEFVAHLFYELTIILQIGFYCYLGNEIIHSSEMLPVQSYFSNFLCFGKKTKAALLLFMHVSMARTTPIIARSIVRFEFSLSTFITILKHTYSVVTVFQSIM